MFSCIFDLFRLIFWPCEEFDYQITSPKQIYHKIQIDSLKVLTLLITPLFIGTLILFFLYSRNWQSSIVLVGLALTIGTNLLCIYFLVNSDNNNNNKQPISADDLHKYTFIGLIALLIPLFLEVFLFSTHLCRSSVVLLPLAFSHIPHADTKLFTFKQIQFTPRFLLGCSVSPIGFSMLIADRAIGSETQIKESQPVQQDYRMDYGYWTSITVAYFMCVGLIIIRRLYIILHTQFEHSNSNLIHSITHHFRTPLHTIVTSCKLLDVGEKEEELTTKQQESLEIIQDCAQTVLAYINTIIDTNKLETKQLELNIMPQIDIWNSVELCVQKLYPMAKSKGLQLWSKISNKVPQYIQCDEFRLEQILMNLLGNAIKYTNKGIISVEVDVAEIDTNSNKFWLIVNVTDTGVGLHIYEQLTLFEKFPVKSDKSYNLNNAIHSASMGLYVCNELCKLMNGGITVKSVKGLGSSFVMKVQVLKEFQPSDSTLCKLSQTEDNNVNFLDNKKQSVNILAIVPQFIADILREYLAVFNVNVVKLSRNANKSGQINMQTALKTIESFNVIIQSSETRFNDIVKELLFINRSALQFSEALIIDFDQDKRNSEENSAYKLKIMNEYKLLTGLNENKVIFLPAPIRKAEIIQTYQWITNKAISASVSQDVTKLISSASNSTSCSSSSSNEKSNGQFIGSVCLPPAPSLASNSKHRGHLLAEAQLSTPSCTLYRLLSEENISTGLSLSINKQPSWIMNRVSENTSSSSNSLTIPNERTLTFEESSQKQHSESSIKEQQTNLTEELARSIQATPRSQSELLILETPSLSNRSITTSSVLQNKTKTKKTSKLFVNNPSSMYVLIVDDSRVNSKVAQHLLKMGEIDSEVVFSGEEAINRIMNSNMKSFTHILTDIHMPDMDGVQLTKLIRKLNNNQIMIQPVIIGFTASPSKELTSRGITAGMQGFVSKPIEIQALASLLAINPLSLPENTKQQSK